MNTICQVSIFPNAQNFATLQFTMLHAWRYRKGNRKPLLDVAWLVAFCHIFMGGILIILLCDMMRTVMHAKYVDDLTIAEAFNLKQAIIPNPGRELPDAFHDRLGQQLDTEKSKVYEEILQIEEYAAEHEMRLNVAKSKFMLFNPTENFDFTLR